MKWVTRDHIHLDRVAAPWLIRRFVDPEARFVFVPWGNDVTLPSDAIPFGLPGVELSSHDQNGTTFSKIVRKYGIDDPAVKMLDGIVAAGVAHAIGCEPAGASPPEAIGLAAFAEGMLMWAATDEENLEKSMALYDALYSYCLSELMVDDQATLAALERRARVPFIREEARRRLKAP